MSRSVFSLHVSRENLPDLIASGSSTRFHETDITDAVGGAIASGEMLVGKWSQSFGDPFPDFIAVNDSDFDDISAWMSAYLSGLSPISQWARVWKISDLRRLIDISVEPALGQELGAWVGAILAELSEGPTPVNLKLASGASALATSTYCAARALAVWENYASFDELLDRFILLSGGRRGPARDIPREHILALWFVLGGARWRAKPPVEQRAFEVISNVVDGVRSAEAVAQDDIVHVIEYVAATFKIPELSRCATGPQGRRVEALDVLGKRLIDGPKSALTSAIMGIGASLVDPGAAVLPELLRRYSNSLPSATLWAGAFAGLWMPVRVLSDHDGLGRLIAKQLLKAGDLFAKPEADISFDELLRWTGGNLSNRPPVRGLQARTLLVELMPGVSTPLPLTRENPTTATREATPRVGTSGEKTVPQTLLDLADQRPDEGQRFSRDQNGDSTSVLARLENVERQLAELLRKSGRTAARSKSIKS